MNSADLPAFTTRFAAHFVAYGRPAREELIASAWQQLGPYSLADVVDAIGEYERADSDQHPITIVQLKRRVHAKREAHRRLREQRLAEQQREQQPPSPHAEAFRSMWRALKAGEYASPRAWCEATAGSRAVPRAHVAFAAECLALMGPARARPELPADAGPLRRLSVAMLAKRETQAETEAEREARLEREAIQGEAEPVH